MGDELTDDKPELTWDSHYDDPKADVVLVSSDNVQFRLHSWVLRKSSNFIANMYEISNAGTPSDTPIHLSISSKLLSIFADLSSCRHLLVPPIPLEGVWQLMQVCEHMQSTNIESQLLECVRNSVATEPWEAFVIASKRNDIGLAKAALTAMSGDNPATRLPKITKAELLSVEPEYMAALIRHRMISSGPVIVYSSRQVGYHTKRWSDVAASFDLNE